VLYSPAAYASNQQGTEVDMGLLDDSAGGSLVVLEAPSVHKSFLSVKESVHLACGPLVVMVEMP